MRKLLTTLAVLAVAVLGLIAGTALASNGQGGNGWYLHTSKPNAHGLVTTTCNRDNGFSAHDATVTGPFTDNKCALLVVDPPTTTGGDTTSGGDTTAGGDTTTGSDTTTADTEVAHHYTGEGHSICSEDPAKPIGSVHYATDAAWVSDGSKDGEWIAGACPDLTPPGDGGGGGETTPPPVVIQATIEGPSQTFLCYSIFEVDPAVYTFDWAWHWLTSPSDHYFTPYAVKGNVQYGTNVGGYHLICNAELLGLTTGTPTTYTDSDGQVFNQAWADVMATDHGSYNGMTLNVFPIVG